jgi:hypothetical protein
VPAPINSAIPPYYSHARQNGVIPEHAGALLLSAAPTEGRATVSLDNTGVEAYKSSKRGVAYNH